MGEMRRDRRVTIRLSELDYGVLEAVARVQGVALGALIRTVAVRYAGQVGADRALAGATMRRRSVPSPPASAARSPESERERLAARTALLRGRP